MIPVIIKNLIIFVENIDNIDTCPHRLILKKTKGDNTFQTTENEKNSSWYPIPGLLRFLIDLLITVDCPDLIKGVTK